MNGQREPKDRSKLSTNSKHITKDRTKTSTKKFNKTGGRKKNKQIEINVNDADVNAADIGPINKRRSKAHDNDFSWYNHYPALVQNASGVNYASSVGSQIRWNSPIVGGKQINYPGTYAAPGICTIGYLPTYGKLDGTVETPLSRVWAQLYSAMRIKLGSRADYDPTDTLLYIIAMDSAYTLYGLCAKAYGLTNQVSPFNLYLLKQLTQASGFDYTSISKNRADFRDLINQFAVTLSKYMVPSDLDIFKRHMWLVQNVFTDSSTAKAQLYNFKPEGIYLLNELTSGDKVLEYMPLKGTGTNGLITSGDLYNWIQNVLLALDSSQDIIQMSADIAKAWESKTLAAALIPETYVTPISYSQEVLSQIENLNLSGVLLHDPTTANAPNLNIKVEMALTDTLGPRLRQEIWTAPLVNMNTGTALSNTDGREAAGQLAITRNGFVNFHWPNPSNEDTVIATRGLVNIKRSGIPTGQTETCTQIGSCGSEVFTVAALYGNDVNGMVAKYYSSYVSGSGVTNVTTMWSSFDWAPAINYITTTSTAIDVYRFQDIDMYGVIDQEQITMLHYNCILSMFYSDLYPESVVNMPSR